MNKHRIFVQEFGGYRAPFGAQVANVRVQPRPEYSPTGEGQPVARAVLGAGEEVTEQFIVVLRALVEAVTHETPV